MIMITTIANKNMKNVIVWFDVPTLDFERAVKFYSRILGDEIKVDEFMSQRLGFFPMEDREGVGGDIIPPDPRLKPSAEGMRIYLNCDGRLDEALGLVEPAGGKIIQPKTSIGEAGWTALIMDTEGNTIGLHSFT